MDIIILVKTLSILFPLNPLFKSEVAKACNIKCARNYGEYECMHARITLLMKTDLEIPNLILPSW